MGDPELRSDEKVLVRTPGVYVKSIPFEGILTNRRIILIDRAKNLLPPKEIPLVTIKEVESGENAIRDQIITLSVMAKTGETRQMILTFSRQTGGNRIKERDSWARIIKENASSSYDQVIRKVIPGPEPAQRRAEPSTGPRYEVIHSPLQQLATSSDQHRPAGPVMDDISPVRRSAPSSPVTSVPQSPAVRTPDIAPISTNIICPKCGNKIPAESVFCNRCGSPVTQIPPVSAPVQTTAALPIVKTPSARPIDEEIHSIEPLIEPSTVKIPADALRAEPVKPPLRPSLSWDDEEKPETASLPEAEIPKKEPAGKGFLPQLFSVKSTDTAAPVPSSGVTDETPAPPKPPRRHSFIQDKQTVLTVAIALVVIVIIAAGALFVYPILTSGGLTLPFGSGNGTPAPATTSSVILPKGTIVVKETPAPVIPPTGVYVHINYMGGFKGSYGISDTITTVPGNSGDRIWEVENATNSTVQAKFEKLDGSSHELLVEIYKDGKLLTSGSTTIGHGSVALSVNMITGVAAAPVTSGGGSTAKTTTADEVTTAAAVKAPAPAADTKTVTTTTVVAVASTAAH
jgi:hypothetical protein